MHCKKNKNIKIIKKQIRNIYDDAYHGRSSGFIITEIVVAIGVLMIVVMPILNFIVISQAENIFSLSGAKVLNEIPGINYFLNPDSREIKEIGSDNYSWAKFGGPDLISFLNIESIKNQNSNRSCQLLFSKNENLINGTWPNFNIATVQYSEHIAILDNIPSSIALVHDTLGEQIFFIGFNSASTSNYDLRIFDNRSPITETVSTTPTEIDFVANETGGTSTENLPIDTVAKFFGKSLAKSLFFGPGILALKVNNKFLTIIERSYVFPISYSHVGNFLNASYLTSTSTDIFTKIPSFLVGNILPKSVSLSGSLLGIGGEKYEGSDLRVMDLESGAQVYDAEVGAGVNDISVINKLNTLDKIYTYIATPKNPEIELFDRGTSTLSFDLPGSSGNGKSISLTPYGLFVGRTLGNDEFVEIIDGSIVRNFNLNKSIVKIIQINDGRILMLLTNDPAEAIVFLGLSFVDGKYVKLHAIELPAMVNDITCDFEDIYAVLNSTSSPSVKISF